ncbi:hypothetical protein VN97_g4754 [Penicillium thymicola]|uniref:Uncharacterized protein n=1 Tax=Penicillium thymicola TaxID=293382 RepID=A0AAI9TK13_PENTH|nr:hypothetical protein VN97_g4754 [Penicillium thymicola]
MAMGGAAPFEVLYVRSIAPGRIDIIQEAKTVVGRSFIGFFWRHLQKRVGKLTNRQRRVKGRALVEPQITSRFPLQPSFSLTSTSRFSQTWLTRLFVFCPLWTLHRMLLSNPTKRYTSRKMYRLS